MRERLQRLFTWFQHRAKTLDLLGEYTRAVYRAWNDYLWGELPVASVVIWWMFGSPPMWVVVPAFFWAFLIAGYYVWRKERLGNVSDEFRGEIYAGIVQSDPTVELLGYRGGRVFIGLQITNVGPPASIRTWQAGYKSRNTGHGMALTNDLLVEGPVETLPHGIRGNNLRGDYRVFTTGETREGWIAFDVDGGDPGGSDLLTSVSLLFTDAFGKPHEISWLPEWARK